LAGDLRAILIIVLGSRQVLKTTLNLATLAFIPLILHEFIGVDIVPIVGQHLLLFKRIEPFEGAT
jgi:hypothetical protein